MINLPQAEHLPPWFQPYEEEHDDTDYEDEGDVSPQNGERSEAVAAGPGGKEGESLDAAPSHTKTADGEGPDPRESSAGVG